MSASCYDAFAKPRCERRLPMRFQPHEDAVAVYQYWQQRNGGERRVLK